MKELRSNSVPHRAGGRIGLDVAIPGAGRLRARHLVLDFNGTLAEAGVLRAPVARRLARLARRFEVAVLTADTFGTAAASLRGLAVAVSTIRGGRDKESFVRRRSREGVVAVGKRLPGQAFLTTTDDRLLAAAAGAETVFSDVRMLRKATLAVAVLGREGMDPHLLSCARIPVRRIEDALDLLLDARRIVATWPPGARQARTAAPSAEPVRPGRLHRCPTPRRPGRRDRRASVGRAGAGIPS